MALLDRVSPEVTQIATTHNYINQRYSAALGESDGSYLKPDVAEEVAYRYGNQEVVGIVMARGQINYKSNKTFEHAEEERILTPVFVEDASAGASNASVQYTMTDSSRAFLLEQTQPYVDSVTYPSGYPNASSGSTVATFPIRDKDIIEFPGGVQAYVTAADPSAGTFTCYPTQDGENLPAITSDQQIIIKGNAVPESSDNVSSRNGRLLTYKNTMQTFRAFHKWSGDSSAEKGWVPVKGKNPKTGASQDGYLWYLKGVRDEYLRHCYEVESTLLTGKKITNPTLLGVIEDTSTTEGMIPQIRQMGQVSGYSTIDYTTLEDMVVKLNAERGSMDNHIAGGINFVLSLDTMQREDSNLQAGGIEYARFADKDRINNFGFSGFKVAGYNFTYSTNDIFSDPNGLGSTDHDYKDMGIVMPYSDTVSYDRDGNSVQVPSMRINTLTEDGGTVRFKKDWVTGTLLDAQTDSKDEGRWDILTQCGLEMFAVNRWGLFEKE